jgi:hypothetical protein
MSPSSSDASRPGPREDRGLPADGSEEGRAHRPEDGGASDGRRLPRAPRPPDAGRGGPARRPAFRPVETQSRLDGSDIAKAILPFIEKERGFVRSSRI